MKEETGSFKKRHQMKLIDTNGKLIIDKQNIKNKWQSYLETVFQDQRPEISYPTLKLITGPDIEAQDDEAAELDDKDLRIISNLFWNQTVCMKLDEEETELVNISQGVRQGCILSLLIFNMYSERIFNNALNEE
ncbi:Hypothetical protein CINCED_3A013606 [Cinara cedri]|uniref:Reverse transcriptase domain n=1 Tax=Cinara cedri TaxID=506608 RepID=A0A5E4MCI8_9HEMI|nr:Hypothetical protein CINCED_3A013606 [Cinara cedri]